MVEKEVSVNSLYQEDLSQLNKDHNHQFFRLLRIVQFDDRTVSCELRTFSLQDAPPYAALSYCWGKGKRDKLAHFVQQEQSQSRLECPSLGITSHLHSGLQRLKVLNQLGWLWNDAICINQDSDDEKGDQVSRMQSIFYRAMMVYIWLGAGSICSTFGGQSKLEKVGGLPIASVMSLSSQDPGLWWERLWVIQELCACANVQVLLGDLYLEWHDFVFSMVQRCSITLHSSLAREELDFAHVTSELQSAKARRRRARAYNADNLVVEKKDQLGTPDDDPWLEEIIIGRMMVALYSIRTYVRQRGKAELDLLTLLNLTGLWRAKFRIPLIEYMDCLALHLSKLVKT